MEGHVSEVPCLVMCLKSYDRTSYWKEWKPSISTNPQSLHLIYKLCGFCSTCENSLVSPPEKRFPSGKSPPPNRVVTAARRGTSCSEGGKSHDPHPITRLRSVTLHKNWLSTSFITRSPYVSSTLNPHHSPSPLTLQNHPNDHQFHKFTNSQFKSSIPSKQSELRAQNVWTSLKASGKHLVVGRFLLLFQKFFRNFFLFYFRVLEWGLGN